ncbi:MAG TPA: universal stress protein [Solirubrobacteraceae bacterium]|nr:universal stress protein [Solirubrobacteraceae bacterium]
MFEKVIVGYASDQAGRDALAFARQLLGTLGGRLTLVFPYHPLMARDPAEKVETRVREEALAQLRGVELAPPVCHWTSSWPIRGLHKMASYEGADLIVIGAAQEHHADPRRLSLMERMVHAAPCAVAVAPPGYAQRVPSPIRRIGVGCSEDEQSSAAVRVADRLAKEMAAGLELIAGAGISLEAIGYPGSLPSPPKIEDEPYDEAQRLLDRFAQGLRAQARLTVLRTDPVRALVERSEQLDLLVLGSRGYGPVGHVLLGSVSAEVMRSARCPVLVMPCGASAPAIA